MVCRRDNIEASSQVIQFGPIESLEMNGIDEQGKMFCLASDVATGVEKGEIDGAIVNNLECV